jgi:crossover junction endodeoxyribonuclease RuvC
MKVLAIDPGFDRCGVAVLCRINGKETLLYSHCITTDKSASLADRLLLIGTEITKTIETYSPDTVAVETLFFNKNITTAIGVAQARGVILFIAKLHHCTLYEFGPQEIKVAVTGYGKSDKTAVYRMLERLVVNIPKKALDDEYDAIAVGLTCLAHHGRI